MKAIHSWRALIYLRLVQAKNFLRTLLRQSGFWAALIGMGIGIAMVRVLSGGMSDGSNAGGPESFAAPASLGEIPSFELAAGTLVWVLIIWNLLQRTKRAPFLIKEPDAVLILTSPISSRSFLGFQLAVGNLHLLWMAVWWLGISMLLLRADTEQESFLFWWTYVGYLVAMLVGRSCGFAEWTWLQAVEGKDPERAERVRRGVRLGVTALSLLALIWVTEPIARGLNLGAGGRIWDPSAFGRVVERLDAVTSIPPAAWVRAVVASGSAADTSGPTTGVLPAPEAPAQVTPPPGAPAPDAAAPGAPAPPTSAPAAAPSLSARFWGGLLPALVLVGLAQTVAIRFATDYYDPLVRRAEEEGDLLRRASGRDADAQAVALEALVGGTKWMAHLPPFGRGPMALLWSGLTRSLRLNAAIATVAIATNVILGAGLGAAIRWWGLSAKWALLGPALLTLLSGNSGNLMTELGRPYIYLFPGSAWKKLLSTGLVSVVDNAAHGFLVIAMAAVVAQLGFTDVMVGLVIIVAAAILAQAAAGLGQIALPLWIRGGVRSLLLLVLTLVLAGPGLVLGFVGARGSAATMVLPVAVAFLVPAVVAFVLSVSIFGRAEMSR